MQAFISGSKDIVDISSIILKMKFHSEGLRMVSRILNYPTDAHVLAAELHEKESVLMQHMQVRCEGCGTAWACGIPCWRGC